MWLLSFLGLSYEDAIWWHDVADWILVFSLIIGVIATFITIKTAGIKEEYLKRDLSASNVQIAELGKEASDSKERAAKIEHETEELREKNISLERAISPRILEQAVTGQALKPFTIWRLRLYRHQILSL